MATFFGGGVNADDIIAEITDSAPATLNTLNELAAALNDDANFASTVTTAIATKQDSVSGVSSTEIGYLDGVTSAIQTQLNGKQAIVSGVSDTEIGYLDGVTSAIQTQLDDKAAKLQTMEQLTTSQNLASGSNNKLFYSLSSSTFTVTVNFANIQVGETIDFLQTSTGKITLAFGMGVSFVSDANKRSTNGAGTAMTLICYEYDGSNKKVAIVGNLS